MRNRIRGGGLTETQRIAVRFVVLLLLATPVLSVCEVSARSEEYFTRDFEWKYGGYLWKWELNFPHSYYSAYKGVSVNDRTESGVAGWSYLVTTKDSYVQSMAERLREASQRMRWGSRDEVNFVLAFVQSLPYTVDKVTSGYDEYPRFPLESLVDGGGDCEDTSVLFAALVAVLGYDSVFINPEGHLMVGVSGNFRGWYFEYGSQNVRYYSCETTGEGWLVGQLPEPFQNKKVNIFHVDPSKQFDPHMGIVWYFYGEYLMLGGGILVAVLVVSVIWLSSKRKTAPRPKAPIPAQPRAPSLVRFCPVCGSQTSYVQQYQRYYCYRCQRYIESQS